MVGASGFLGRHLGPELLRRGHEVVGTSRDGRAGEALDVTDADRCLDLVSRRDPEVVVNLAGAGVTAGSADQSSMCDVNDHGPANLVRAATLAGVRLVHVASSTEPLPGMLPESVYSKTKADGTDQVARAMGEGVVPITIARVHNAYGVDQPHGRFIGDVIRAMASGGEFTLRYPGRVRDFCWVDEVTARLADVTEGVVAPGAAYDVGTGVGLTLLEAAVIIRDAFGTPPATLHWADGDAADPAPESFAGDAGLALLECPTTLADGLRHIEGNGI